MFAPERVRVPEPNLYMPPEPEITPEKVVELLSRPEAKIPPLSVTLPAPAREPISRMWPFASSVAPEEIVTALELDSAPLPELSLLTPAFSVPATIEVAPVNVLPPDNVSR